MNSRERIIEALNHGKTDRVAVDLGATNATGVNAIVYRELKRLLGMSGKPVKVFDIIGQLAEIEPDVLEVMGGDAVMLRKLAPSLGIPVRGWKPGKLTDGTDCICADSYNPVMNEKGDMELHTLTDGSDMIHPYMPGHPFGLNGKRRVLARCPNGSHAFCRVYHPFTADAADTADASDTAGDAGAAGAAGAADATGGSLVETAEQLDKFIFPELTDEEAAFAGNEAKRLYETTDKAICGAFNGGIFETGQLYWGHEDFFVYMASDPDFMRYFLEKRTAVFMKDLEKYLKAAGRYIQVINFWDDLGTQTSLLISPKMYRDMIKPHHAKLFEYINRNYPGIKVLLHSCGAISELIPDLIEIGVHALNPVQITAAGMDPAVLKKKYGKDIVFWGGGVDTQKTLNSGTTTQVAQMAEDMLDIFSPGGGYVFSQVHNVEWCVPAENLLAAFRTARDYKWRDAG